MNNSLNPTLQRLLALCRLDRTWFRGEGIWLYDEQARPFLDCHGQHGSATLGHNNTAVSTAVRAALDKFEPSFVQPYRAPHAIALANELPRLAPGMDRCVFTTSGAEAIDAVAECHAAGIRVKMITGDHAATARAIAGLIGLKNRDSVLTGADVDAMDDAALAEAAVGTDIFARTSPAHKLRLVTARPTVLQDRKSAAAALRYPSSPVVTYFVLPGKDLPMIEAGRVKIEQYRPHQRQVDEFSVIYWKQGDLAYLMVSGLDTSSTQQLYLKMRKAL